MRHEQRPLWAATLLGLLAALSATAQPPDDTTKTLAKLPIYAGTDAESKADWLIDGSPFKADVFRGAGANEVVLANGLVARTFRLSPNAATVGLDNLVTGQALLRAVKPEAIVTINGQRYEVGGLKGQVDHAFLRPDELEQLTADPAALRFVGLEIGRPQERFAWKQVRHHAPEVQWPPPGVHLRLDFALPEPSDERLHALRDVRVSVHYELYDGVPVFSKWLTVQNGSGRAITVNHFVSEMLAVVEEFNWVEKREGVPLPHPTSLHVETDQAFGGFQPLNANRHLVQWRPDPEFHTQVNYLREQPCLLVVEPPEGPAQELAPGETFESCRAFELAQDSTERERRGLALRRMYRTIAPWVTENPLMMHVRGSDDATVRRAIEQCAEVGFEMLILSFGSGFNIESTDPAYLDHWRELTDYAHRRGIELGGYSLLASRRISDRDDVVMPEGQTPTFGNSPCLGSHWGTNYFGKLHRFFETTGFDLLEHDGSYPGDVCLSTEHPGHRGFEDSRWNQWRTISDFYRWCRGRGVYLNVPDFYYLSGSTKNGMGYREVNWSLPRAQQVIHTRQNIYDGTWQKTPSMGWMFVPLTEYHGGGAAATIEPLDEHLDHYERMLFSNLALGVQACYRGPRLYDTDRTRTLVKRWVDWFKTYRDILESDLIHGRRADARDLDWMLHVNPKLERKGMLVVFNPLPVPVERELTVNLYHTGLEDSAKVREQGGAERTFTLARDHTIRLPVRVEAEGINWFVIGD